MADIAQHSICISGLASAEIVPEAARNGLNLPEQSGKVRQNRTSTGKVVPNMGTIMERHLKGGKKSYCAQIVIKRGGKSHRESETFSARASAQAWIDRREGVLSKPGAMDRLEDPKLREVIDRYLDDLQDEPGRTKASVLRTIKTYDIADKRCSAINSQDYVDFIRSLPVQPQTRGNYISHLSSVVSIARPAWGYPLSEQALKDAMRVAKKLRLTSKSKRRDRRPSLAELDKIMSHFAEREAEGYTDIPMTKIIPFALFSTRRQEEITRIRRADYQPAVGGEPARILVRDMKHPGEKRGNNTWCDLPAEAAVFVEAALASHNHDLVFPYNHRTIGSYFTDAHQMLAIDDLRFHDLRHEGASWLFERGGLDIPRIAKITGHRDWKSLQGYSHIRQTGDKYADWKWKNL